MLGSRMHTRIVIVEYTRATSLLFVLPCLLFFLSLDSFMSRVFWFSLWGYLRTDFWLLLLFLLLTYIDLFSSPSIGKKKMSAATDPPAPPQIPRILMPEPKVVPQTQREQRRPIVCEAAAPAYREKCRPHTPRRPGTAHPPSVAELREIQVRLLTRRMQKPEIDPAWDTPCTDIGRTTSREQRERALDSACRASSACSPHLDDAELHQDESRRNAANRLFPFSKCTTREQRAVCSDRFTTPLTSEVEPSQCIPTQPKPRVSPITPVGEARTTPFEQQLPRKPMDWSERMRLAFIKRQEEDEWYRVRGLKSSSHRRETPPWPGPFMLPSYEAQWSTHVPTPSFYKSVTKRCAYGVRGLAPALASSSKGKSTRKAVPNKTTSNLVEGKEPEAESNKRALSRCLVNYATALGRDRATLSRVAAPSRSIAFDFNVCDAVTRGSMPSFDIGKCRPRSACVNSRASQNLALNPKRTQVEPHVPSPRIGPHLTARMRRQLAMQAAKTLPSQPPPVVARQEGDYQIRSETLVHPKIVRCIRF